MNEILKVIADNPALLQAVKETILKQFNLEVVTDDMTDEQIGQITRARTKGIQKVETAFSEIARYKTLSDKPPGGNPAR